MGLLDFGINTSEISQFERDVILADRTLDKEAKIADRLAARRMARKMKSRAPRGLTGNLRRSIGASKGVISIGAIYAGVINFGWPARNIEPQEFIYTTISQSKKEVMKDHEKAADKSMRFIVMG